MWEQRLTLSSCMQYVKACNFIFRKGADGRFLGLEECISLFFCAGKLLGECVCIPGDTILDGGNRCFVIWGVGFVDDLHSFLYVPQVFVRGVTLSVPIIL